MKGKCLCATVEFELDGPLPKLYQCHCSLCRKVSGSSANAALVVPAAQFAWLGGERCITEYQTASGYKSHFCNRCGSPLPNLTRHDNAWWIPVGLLEDSDELRLGVHLFVSSRARWDVIADGIPHYDEMPAADRLDALLEPGPVSS